MEKRIKLLEGMDVYFPHVDGVINVMHNYCTYANKKIDVLAIAPNVNKKYKDNFPYRIKRCKSIYVPILNAHYCQATGDAKFYKSIMAEKFDIVHCNSPFNMSKFMLKVARKQNIPAVATFHSNMRPIFQHVVKSKALAELMVQSIGDIYNQFDEVFVVSPPVAEQCRSFGYTGKISYLPFGTNLPKYNNKDELIEKANKVFHLDKDELLFIYIGRVEKLKRIDFSLRSLKILKNKGVKFKFYIAGKGDAQKPLEKLVEKLGFTEDEVKFLGFLPEEHFPLFYGRADLMLFPSLYDNFGLVKVEAAAFDTPGIYIKNSCAGYGITDGINGYLSANNYESFANRIYEAIQNREALKQVGKQAGKDLYITWEECTNKFIERLEEIVANYKPKDTTVKTKRTVTQVKHFPKDKTKTKDKKLSKKIKKVI